MTPASTPREQPAGHSEAPRPVPTPPRGHVQGSAALLDVGPRLAALSDLPMHERAADLQALHGDLVSLLRDAEG